MDYAYPTREEIQNLKQKYIDFIGCPSAFKKEYTTMLREFFAKYNQYIFDLLLSNVDHTEPTQEATIPSMEEVGLFQDLRKRLFVNF